MGGESLAKMSGENHPMFGKSGENNHMFGRIHSAESLAKMSAALSGENNPMYGRTGVNYQCMVKLAKKILSMKTIKKNVFLYALDRKGKTFTGLCLY